MADENGKEAGNPVEGLSKEEVAALRGVLSRLEWILFQAVLAQLKKVAIVAGAIVTIFGIASLATINSAAVDAAANKLSSNSEIRDQVVSGATLKLEKVNQVLQKSADLDRRLDEEQAGAMRIIAADLEQILSMVRQLNGDMKQNGRVSSAEQ